MLRYAHAQKGARSNKQTHKLNDNANHKKNK